MSPRLIRLWFCLACALLAAAIADPLLESASNAGWFGPGTFTDRSTLDVLPALLFACALIALQIAAKARAALRASGQSPAALLRASDRALASSLPVSIVAAFLLQMLVLYAMETGEQYVVWGHALGATIWLGAPVAVSVTSHALTCIGVAFLLSRALSVLALATLKIIRLWCGDGRRNLPASVSAVPGHRLARFRRVRMLGSVGERAPPSLLNVA